MLAVLEIRRRMYWAISLFFSGEPPRALADAFMSRGMVFPHADPTRYPELAEGFAELEAFVSAYEDAETLHHAMVNDYQKLFPKDSKNGISRCESDWIDGESSSTLQAVERAYLRAGYEPSGNKVLFFKDDIAIESEFMHCLCKRSIEDRANLEYYIEQEVSFLREHLLKWVPSFCDAIIELSDSDYFVAVAKITKGFIIMDLEIAEMILSGEIL
ncbi:hypothetical protein DRN98_04970 [Methanosarcinales archaeon]|nr:MAG: hypothetical protein DRN98_04970 [Methanosarcinales archaeon]